MGRGRGWVGVAVGLLVGCGGGAQQAPEHVPSGSARHSLSIRVVGQGEVRTGEGALTCASDCVETFAAGTAVELVARPADRWQLQAFDGACGGAGGCRLSMVSDAAVTVTFVATPTEPILPVDPCAGVVPADPGPSLTRSVRIYGGERRFCATATTDGRGTVAGSEFGMGPPGWTLFSADGAPLGPPLFTEEALPQADGFHGFDPYATAVQVWSGDGQLRTTTQLGRRPDDHATVHSTDLLFPAATGGSVAVRSVCGRPDSAQPNLFVWRIDAAGNIVGRTELTWVNCPSDVAAVSDALDRTLVTVSRSWKRESFARWFDRTGAPLTEWFAFGPFPDDEGWVAASPQPLIGGGVAWSVHGRWGVLFPSGLARADPVPAFLADQHRLRTVRAGRAYALVPEARADTLELYAPSGARCGSVQLPRKGLLFIGEDGTLLQLAGDDGCELTWWPGLLR